MANYCCTLRTNYFHVKDPEKFFEVMENVCSCEGDIEIFREKDDNGNDVFGFGGYGAIVGYAEDGNSDPDYDAFITHLQGCVADNDAIIISEAGNEKLRYVICVSTVVTSRDVAFFDAKQIAISKAAELLKNPNWSTDTDY